MIKRAYDVTYLEYAFVIIVMCQGVVLAIFRFREPVYSYIVSKEVKSWFGILAYYEDQKSKQSAS